MKRIVVAVVLVAVFAGAYVWFSRKAPLPPPAPATPSVAETKQRERQDLFGDEVNVSGTEWRESGLGYRILNAGARPKPGIGTPVKMTYVGRLKDGTVFDRSDKPTEFLIGTTIPGLSVGLQMLGTGGKAVFLIPPSLAYGNRKVMGIPPGSGLIFEVQVAAVGP